MFQSIQRSLSSLGARVTESISLRRRRSPEPTSSFATELDSADGRARALEEDIAHLHEETVGRYGSRTDSIADTATAVDSQWDAASREEEDQDPATVKDKGTNDKESESSSMSDDDQVHLTPEGLQLRALLDAYDAEQARKSTADEDDDDFAGLYSRMQQAQNDQDADETRSIRSVTQQLAQNNSLASYAAEKSTCVENFYKEHKTFEECTNWQLYKYAGDLNGVACDPSFLSKGHWTRMRNQMAMASQDLYRRVSDQEEIDPRNDDTRAVVMGLIERLTKELDSYV